MIDIAILTVLSSVVIYSFIHDKKYEKKEREITIIIAKKEKKNL